jgi:hypothetical protein
MRSFGHTGNVSLVESFRDLPRPARCALIGAVCLGAIGCAVGLGVGLHVHPPTAWAATFEIGIPSAALGFALGFGVGWLLEVAHRLRPGQPR